MHPSMLSCWWGRPGIGGGFELRSVFLFKCPAPGKSSWVKKVQIPQTRVIIVGQKNSTNDQKSIPWAHLQRQIPFLCPASHPPPPLPTQRFNIDRCIIIKVLVSNSNWSEWSTIQGVIGRVISKSDEREARGRFEYTSAITP